MEGPKTKNISTLYTLPDSGQAANADLKRLFMLQQRFSGSGFFQLLEPPL